MVLSVIFSKWYLSFIRHVWSEWITCYLYLETSFTGVQRPDRELHHILHCPSPEGQCQHNQSACGCLQCFRYVAKQTLQMLKCDCFTHILNPILQEISTIDTVSMWTPKIVSPIQRPSTCEIQSVLMKFFFELLEKSGICGKLCRD